jgi:hypothetical protein
MPSAKQIEQASVCSFIATPLGGLIDRIGIFIMFLFIVFGEKIMMCVANLLI